MCKFSNKHKEDRTLRDLTIMDNVKKETKSKSNHRNWWLCHNVKSKNLRIQRHIRLVLILSHEFSVFSHGREMRNATRKRRRNKPSNPRKYWSGTNIDTNPVKKQLLYDQKDFKVSRLTIQSTHCPPPQPNLIPTPLIAFRNPTREFCSQLRNRFPQRRA